MAWNALQRAPDGLHQLGLPQVLQTRYAIMNMEDCVFDSE